MTTDRTPHPETEEMLANMANMANLGPRKTGSLRRKTAAYFDALKYALRLAAIG